MRHRDLELRSATNHTTGRLVGSTLAVTGIVTLLLGLAPKPVERADQDALATDPPATMDFVAMVADAPTWMPLTVPVAGPVVTGAPASPRGSTAVHPVGCRLVAHEGMVRLGRFAARDPAAYRGLESGAPQAHQALVLTTYDATRWTPPGPGRPPADVVTIDGVSWRAVRTSESLVMAADADGTWTYAVVGPQGDVRSSGRPDACLACHAQAPYGELFGDGAGN